MGAVSALTYTQTGEGYRGAEYAAACDHIGEALPLARAGGWLIKRPLAGTPYFDLAAPYPLFDVRDWSLLENDFSGLDKEKFVTVTVVADPLADVSYHDLFTLFPERHVKLKSHFIADLSRNIEDFVSPGHRYKARRALKKATVDHVTDKEACLSQWINLYAQLIERHHIGGAALFSPSSFARQFAMEEMHLFAAREGEETVAMHLWLEQGNRVYYHLGASSQRGYELRATYAIMWDALHFFKRKGIAVAGLGGVAGNSDDPGNGLAQFKRGFSTGNLPSMLCGKVMNPGVYDRLSKERGKEDSPFFPKYRHDEFRSA